jgi:hypothetical protein
MPFEATLEAAPRLVSDPPQSIGGGDFVGNGFHQSGRDYFATERFFAAGVAPPNVPTLTPVVP